LKMPIVEDVKNELFVSNVFYDGSWFFFYEYIPMNTDPRKISFL